MKILLALTSATLLLAAASWATASAPYRPDKDAAAAALQVEMSHGETFDGSPAWNAAITCRGYVNHRLFTCTWKDGAGSGSARILFGATAVAKPKVTVLTDYTCAQRSGPDCRDQ